MSMYGPDGPDRAFIMAITFFRKSAMKKPTKHMLATRITALAIHLQI